jgi:Tfp pilus assembly protein PilO
MIEKLNNTLKILTGEQKKIMIAAAIIIFSFFIVWGFIYVPQRNEFLRIKRTITATEDEITEIMKIASGKDLAFAIGELRGGLAAVKARLPVSEQVVVSYLSNQAEKYHLEMKSVVYANRRMVENSIANTDIEELPVTMQVSGEYRSLGEFLSALEKSSELLVSLRQLDVKSNGPGRVDLDISLQLSTYLLKE